MGLLDMVGPVMVGPSSSHTAGACRLALLARHMLVAPPTRARLTLHGSFAKTAKGHGTDLALAAGLLGYFPDDERIRDALALAARSGLELDFGAADLGDVHPNSVRIELENDAETAAALGSSLGGGLVRVSEVNGFEVRFTGAYHTLLVLHDDKPGVIARVARVIADDDGNIGTLHSARRKRGGLAMMSIEVDRRLAQYALDYLTNVPYIHWMRMLPEVMSGETAAEVATSASTASTAAEPASRADRAPSRDGDRGADRGAERGPDDGGAP